MARKKKTMGDSPELAPITPEQAQAILADKELRAACEREGVDLTLIVENLQAPVSERLGRHQRAYEMAMAAFQMGRELGLHP